MPKDEPKELPLCWKSTETTSIALTNIWNMEIAELMFIGIIIFDNGKKINPTRSLAILPLNFKVIQ